MRKSSKGKIKRSFTIDTVHDINGCKMNLNNTANLQKRLISLPSSPHLISKI